MTGFDGFVVMAERGCLQVLQFWRSLRAKFPFSKLDFISQVPRYAHSVYPRWISDEMFGGCYPNTVNKQRVAPERCFLHVITTHARIQLSTAIEILI